MAEGILIDEPVSVDESIPVAEKWTPPSMPRRVVRAACRLGYRLVLWYWVCFTFPFPLDLIGLPFNFVEPANQPQWMQKAGEYYGNAFKWFYELKGESCKWIGEHVLHVDVIIQPTGSGDTMRAYVGCLCAAAIALGLTIVWSVIAWLVRRRYRASCPDAWLGGVVRVLVRFFLFEILIGYGFAKVFPMQFAPPSSFRLGQQLGDMSPMGLLWTFMGFSSAYQIFTGTVEVVAGLFLVTRRTTMLGALLTVLAMGQVFALNMCFDVPVKLYSLHYLIMGLYLLAPDLGRLTGVLLLGRGFPAKQFPPMFGSALLDYNILTFRTALVLAMLASQIYFGFTRWNEMYGGPPTPIQGRWDVTSMQVDKHEVDKNQADAWLWLDFMSKNLVRIGAPKPPNSVYRVEWSKDQNEITLTRFNPTSAKFTLTYALPEPDKLELHGTRDGKDVALTLKPAPEKRYELMNRGFHWVSELPYNR